MTKIKQEILEKLAKLYYPLDHQLMERIAFKRGFTESENKNMEEYKLPKNWKDEVYNHSSAILSFDEQDKPNVDTPVSYYYINSKGDRVDCNAMYLRDNDMVVVKNKNGCQVCLSKKDLYICKN
jgi:hypothetical protein